MLQQAMHLLDSEFHGEEFVQETVSCGRTTAVSTHPRLHMANLVVDFINDLMISLETIKLFEIVRRDNVHRKNLLQE